jgi:membrane carboxypeptidase/penicillin-binding protein
VAYTVTKILEENVQYGTGVAAAIGRPVAGKTGTTENHADAWFDGYTRQLSTVVWMGYPKGEIPMLNVHGQAVAGATFPVPIWHEYMAAALWHHKVLGFELPNRYPVWRSITRGSYGSFGYTPTYTPSYTPTYTPTTTATTTATPPPAQTTQAPPPPAAAVKPKPTTTVTPPPPPVTTEPPPPPPVTTTDLPPG